MIAEAVDIVCSDVQNSRERIIFTNKEIIDSSQFEHHNMFTNLNCLTFRISAKPGDVIIALSGPATDS